MNNSAAGPSRNKAGSSQASETTFKHKRGILQKDLQHMMYGFGDDSNLLMSEDWKEKGHYGLANPFKRLPLCIDSILDKLDAKECAEPYNRTYITYSL